MLFLLAGIRVCGLRRARRECREPRRAVRSTTLAPLDYSRICCSTHRRPRCMVRWSATVSTAADATREIDAALASPYFHGATRLRNRLRKREWILSVYGELNRMRAASGVIERRERLSRDAFFEQYYFQNRPLIITGAFDFWPARSLWNLDYLRERCGEREVEVQFGREVGRELRNQSAQAPAHDALCRLCRSRRAERAD